MNKTVLSILFVGWGALVLSPNQYCLAETTVFEDGNFANWSFGSVAEVGSSATATVTGGGSPGSCIQVTTNTGGTAWARAMNGDAIWNPAGGAIHSVSMNMDFKSISAWGQGQGLHVVASQGGQYYAAPFGVSITGSPSVWSTLGMGSFSASDFALVNGADYSIPGRWNGAEHPDFSTSGAPVSFGFIAGNRFSRTYTQLYDNWSLTVENEGPPPPPPPDPIDPQDPPAHTSQYNFVIGAQPYFQWHGITVGLDFSLSIPTMDPIQYNPSITYPKDPITPELKPWETEFNTNNRILGALLSAAAPIEFNALELTGTARLSADVTAQAGIDLENTEDHADIGASIGAGLNLTLNLEADSDLLNGLPKQLRDMLPTEFTFKYPIAGTIPFSTPKIEVPLGGFVFDIDAFRQALADFDPTDDYQTADDVTGSVTISDGDLTIPMTFLDTSDDGKPDKVSVTVGASASAYAETSATAGVDFFFREVDEYGQAVQSKSIFDTLGHLWNRTIELTDATVVRSGTGTVEIHPDGLLELVTGSPVWMTTIVDTEEETNLLAFEADFISEEGAEGILQVFWDSELVATIDERMVGDVEEAFLFTLPDAFGPGTHTLSFRLDPFTGVDSSIVIDNIATGYLVSAFDPVWGDTNGDGIVDELDCANLVAQFGGVPGEESADFNGDDFVDLEDFAILRKNFGFGVVSSPSADHEAITTPEPPTLTLLALGGLAMLKRRRRNAAAIHVRSA